jgi:hypothetical protein
MSMLPNSGENSRRASKNLEYDPVIPCPGCGLVDIDPEQEQLCGDCMDEVARVEDEAVRADTLYWLSHLAREE